MEAAAEHRRLVPIPFLLPTFELRDARIGDARSAFEQIRKANSFSSRVLAYAMQNRISTFAIRRYLVAFNADKVKDAINEPVYSTTLEFGVPVLFFAVESGSEENIRMLHDFGADLQAQTRRRRRSRSMACDYHCVDCSWPATEMQLLGPSQQHLGSGQASPLNKFLCDNEDKQCVVYLDDFEKANDAIRRALLPLLDRGKYTERMGGRELKPGLKTIWVMSVEVSVEMVSKFAHENEYLGSEFLSKAPLEDLEKSLQEELGDKIGNHLCGRLNTVIPFFPLSKTEAVVVAHKCVLEVIRQCREPFSTERNNVRV